jgi:hypothetical protein
MLGLLAGTVALPAARKAAQVVLNSDLGSDPVLDACAVGSQDYYMTQPGGSEHGGGHMFVYTKGTVPEVGTEIELSGFPGQVFEVEEFSDTSRSTKEAANDESFSVVVKGDSGAQIRFSDSDACYTPTEYYAMSSGGAGDEGGGGHIYIHTLGPHPPVGTEVTISGTPEHFVGNGAHKYNPERTEIEKIKWVVVDGDWDTPKGIKEGGNPRSFALQTADGSPSGIPYDKQNSFACYGNNEIYKMTQGGECGAGGYLYLYTRSVRPPIGTKVFLTEFPDVQFVVVEDLEDTTACASTRSARERENPGDFLLQTVDGGPTHLDFTAVGVDDPEAATVGRWGCSGAPGADQVPLGKFMCDALSDPDTAIGSFICVTEEAEDSIVPTCSTWDTDHTMYTLENCCDAPCCSGYTAKGVSPETMQCVPNDWGGYAEECPDCSDTETCSTWDTDTTMYTMDTCGDVTCCHGYSVRGNDENYMQCLPIDWGEREATCPPAEPEKAALCTDLDEGTSGDDYGDTCADYANNKQWCGIASYDDDDFTADTLCCACGGGQMSKKGTAKAAKVAAKKAAKRAAGRGRTRPSPSPLPLCSDSDGNANGDSAGDTCADYYDNPDWCGGEYDDDDFSSDTMCCACGGGGLQVVHAGDKSEADKAKAKKAEAKMAKKKAASLTRARPDPSCSDAEAGADAAGDTCADYYEDTKWCNGKFDDDDFEAKSMCCACGGGATIKTEQEVEHEKASEKKSAGHDRTQASPSPQHSR